MVLWDSPIIFTFLPPNLPKFPFHPFPHNFASAIPLPHQGLFVLLEYFWVWPWGVVSWLSPFQQPRTAHNFLVNFMPNFPPCWGLSGLSLTLLLCLLSCLLWAATLLLPEDIYGLVVCQHLWLLYSLCLLSRSGSGAFEGGSVEYIFHLRLDIAQFLTLSTSVSCGSLCWPSSVATRSFSGKGWEKPYSVNTIQDSRSCFNTMSA